MKKLSIEMLKSILLPYNLTPESVTYLGGGREDSDGIVYSFEQDGKAMAVKIMGFQEPMEKFGDTLKRYEHRIEFAGYLSSGGAAIIGPVTDADGLLYRSGYIEETGFISYLMPKATGRVVPQQEWDATFLDQWGRAVGQAHRLSRDYIHLQCPLLDAQGIPLLGWRNELHSFYNWCNDADVKNKWLEMESRLDALPVERQSFGFIHNDPHVQNVLYDGEKLHLIDFDVANYHWFVTDISIALQSELFMQSGGMERPVFDFDKLKRFMDAFLTGYSKEYHLGDFWLNQIDLLIHYRRMLLFTVTQDWLSQHESAKQEWKRMIMDEPQYISSIL